MANSRGCFRTVERKWWPDSAFVRNSAGVYSVALTSRPMRSCAGAIAVATSENDASPTTMRSTSLPVRSVPRATDPNTKAALTRPARGRRHSRMTSTTPAVFRTMDRSSLKMGLAAFAAK